MSNQHKVFTKTTLLTIGCMSSLSSSLLADNIEAVAGAAFKNLRFAKAAAAPTTAPVLQATTPPPAVAQTVAAPAPTPAATPEPDASAADQAPADEQAGDIPLEADAEASAGTGDEGMEDETPEGTA